MPAPAERDFSQNFPILDRMIFFNHAGVAPLSAPAAEAIRQEMDRQSLAADGPYQVLVIPLLTEGGRRDHVDRVLVVDAPESALERLCPRLGQSTRARLA
jgi:dephospho-CoA kinase